MPKIHGLENVNVLEKSKIPCQIYIRKAGLTCTPLSQATANNGSNVSFLVRPDARTRERLHILYQ